MRFNTDDDMQTMNINDPYRIKNALCSL